jgi:hypothetical protein
LIDPLVKDYVATTLAAFGSDEPDRRKVSFFMFLMENVLKCVSTGNLAKLKNIIYVAKRYHSSCPGIINVYKHIIESIEQRNMVTFPQSVFVEDRSVVFGVPTSYSKVSALAIVQLVAQPQQKEAIKHVECVSRIEAAKSPHGKLIFVPPFEL